MNLAVHARRTATACALATLALGAAATSAHALTLTIDPSLSSVTYTPGGFSFGGPDGDGSLTFPTSQTFALSGRFDLRQETLPITLSFDPLTVVDREETRFESIAVDSGGAATAQATRPMRKAGRRPPSLASATRARAGIPGSWGAEMANANMAKENGGECLRLPPSHQACPTHTWIPRPSARGPPPRATSSPLAITIE